MHRFYSPAKNISANTILISDRNQVHHIKDVLRLEIEDQILVFDEKSCEYRAEIQRLSEQGIVLKIKAKHKCNPVKRINFTIACAIPKKSKMDDIVDKLTQLGIDTIIPMLTRRVIVQLGHDAKLQRQERWRKIMLGASQQSQRNTLPVLEPITKINDILANSKNFDLKLIPTLAGKPGSLKEILQKSRPKNILILIGPEGDFTDEEIAAAEDSGFIPVSLGSLVLRVDTAAVACASFINLLYENN